MSDDSTPDSAGSSSETTFPTPFQKKALWIAITAISIVVTGAVAVGLIGLTGRVLGFLQPVLVPIAVAGILAYLLEPVVVWLKSRGLGHHTAMITVFVAFLFAVVLLIVAVLVPTFGEARAFYENWESYEERTVSFVSRGYETLRDQLGPMIPAEYVEDGLDWIRGEGPTIAQNLGMWIWGRLRGALGLFGYLIGFLLVPVYLFFFLREGHRISQTWTDYLPLRASSFKDEVVGTIQEINGYLISFFRGQMVVSLIDGLLIAIGLRLIGLPYALLFGVFLAILGLIPYIGNVLVMIPAVLVAVGHYGATEWGTIQEGELPEPGQVAEVTLVPSGKVVEKVVTAVNEETEQVQVLVHAWNWLPHVWAYPLIVLAIFITLQQINSLVTAPKIVGDSVGLHPLTVIFSVLFWTLILGGLLGALLAVPLTASIKVLFRRYIWERRLEPAVERRLAEAAEQASESA